jgi:hypothetical protein
MLGEDMTPMTPEERFNKIEDTRQRTAEQQARHEQEIDRHNEAIRGFIVVGRTCLDSIKELREDHRRVSANIDKLREAQSITDEKLKILVDTVDRIIRRENNPQ